jgi:hypothetical protein
MIEQKLNYDILTFPFLTLNYGVLIRRVKFSLCHINRKKPNQDGLNQRTPLDNRHIHELANKPMQ